MSASIDYHGVILGDYDRAGHGSFELHECGYLLNTTNWNHQNFCSPFWRLYHNEKPGASVIVGDRQLPLGPENIVVIPAGTVFSSHGERGNQKHIWLHFSPPLTPTFKIKDFNCRLNAALAANIQNLRKLILDDATKNEEQFRLIYHSCLAVLHSWMATTPVDAQAPLPASISYVLERLEKMLDKELSNDFLAREAGLSVGAFRSTFKAYLGTSPARYVAGRRIREACRLLLFSKLSIEEIADSVGFANRHHFSRIFKEHTGSGPALYRTHNHPAFFREKFTSESS